MLGLCHNFPYTTAKALAICLCDTEVIELTTLLTYLSFPWAPNTFFSPDIKLINTIQLKLQSKFPPSLLAGMLLLQFQAQEMPCLCFLSVALTRDVISPYKSLLTYFINDSVIVAVGLVPLPTQTKIRQLIGSSQSVSPQKTCITGSSYFHREAGSILHILHGSASKNATVPGKPALQWANMSHENGQGGILAARHQSPDLNEGRSKNKCSVKPNLQRCYTRK